MTRPFASALLCVALVSVGSCGGDDDDDGGSASCGTFNACGGTITPGAYTITGSCLSLKGSIEGCAGATIELGNAKMSGTVMLNADMTYTTMQKSKLTTKVNLPAACLMGGNCSLLEGILKQDADTESATCTGDSGCNCTVVSKETTDTGRGTWSAAGNILSMTEEGDTAPTQNEFCAQGTTLRVNLAEPMSMAMPGMMEDFQVSGSITLKRQ